MSLRDIAKEKFLESYQQEFDEVELEAEKTFDWNAIGRNTKGKKYHVTEGVKNLKLDRAILFPYYENRITVDGGYINASPVRAGDDRFIVMQAPPPMAFFHFWEMVWRAKVDTILLISNTGSSEYHRYWPQHEGVTNSMGRLHVKHCGTKNYPIGVTCMGGSVDLEEKTFTVTVKGRRPRKVKQLHFSQWQEDKAPDLMSFFGLVLRVQRCAIKSKGRFVVQSLKGAGRAGTFVASHSLVSDAWKDFVAAENFEEVFVDVKKRVMELREQRYGMVLTEEQYLFIYKVLKKLADLLPNSLTLRSPVTN